MARFRLSGLEARILKVKVDLAWDLSLVAFPVDDRLLARVVRGESETWCLKFYWRVVTLMAMILVDLRRSAEELSNSGVG